MLIDRLSFLEDLSFSDVGATARRRSSLTVWRFIRLREGLLDRASGRPKSGGRNLSGVS